MNLAIENHCLDYYSVNCFSVGLKEQKRKDKTVSVHGEDSTRADWRFEKKFIDAVAEAGLETPRLRRYL